MKLYVDGQLQAQQNHVGGQRRNGFVIGRMFTHNGEFIGAIDEVAYYSHVPHRRRRRPALRRAP